MLVCCRHNDYVIDGDVASYLYIEQYIDLLGLVLPCLLKIFDIFMESKGLIVQHYS
jgi:hypothetical protein